MVKERCRRFWRWCRTGLTRTASFVGTYWPLLMVAALFLAILFVGWQEGQRGPLQARVTQLEERAAHLEEENALLKRQNAEQEARIQTLEKLVADLEQAVVKNTAAIEELQQTVAEPQLPEQVTVTVQQGDTVWDLLTQELGRYPTWEEIQKVVDANNLGNFMDGQGRWIVLIYPGQVLDLGPALGP